MAFLLIAGIAALTAGGLVLGFGVSQRPFELGSALMITGAIVASTGLLLIGLWIVCRELRALAQGLHAGTLPALPRAEAMPAPSRPSEPEPVVIGDLTAPPRSEEPPAPPPWTEPEPAPAPEPPPPPPKRRNLLFSSTSRKERERAAAKAAEEAKPAAPEEERMETAPAPLAPEPAPPPAPADVDPRSSFEAAWPQAERARPGVPLRQPLPPETASTPPPPPPPRVRPDPKPVASEVTILKSGVVDGMAYSLYSDGSIEAQMPEGMVRFSSIEELRAHLDQRA